jgi:hypothetical protein
VSGAERLSEAEVAELTRLEKAATPGPWEVMPDGRARVNLVHVETGPECSAGAGLPVFSVPRKKEGDAELIAAARNALPRLLAERRAFREALAEVYEKLPNVSTTEERYPIWCRIHALLAPRKEELT